MTLRLIALGMIGILLVNLIDDSECHGQLISRDSLSVCQSKLQLTRSQLTFPKRKPNTAAYVIGAAVGVIAGEKFGPFASRRDKEKSDGDGPPFSDFDAGYCLGRLADIILGGVIGLSIPILYSKTSDPAAIDLYVETYLRDNYDDQDLILLQIRESRAALNGYRGIQSVTSQLIDLMLPVIDSVIHYQDSTSVSLDFHDAGLIRNEIDKIVKLDVRTVFYRTEDQTVYELYTGNSGLRFHLNHGSRIYADIKLLYRYFLEDFFKKS